MDKSIAPVIFYFEYYHHANVQVSHGCCQDVLWVANETMSIQQTKQNEDIEK